MVLTMTLGYFSGSILLGLSTLGEFIWRATQFSAIANAPDTEKTLTKFDTKLAQVVQAAGSPGYWVLINLRMLAAGTHCFITICNSP
jgi:hypothetical protein